MGAENQTTSLTTVRCGACGTENQSESRFCQGCGQGLYEPCSGCGKSVALTQKYCGSCGADLEKAVETARQRYDDALAEAVAAARRYDFDHAIALISPAASNKDYRYQDNASQAAQAIEKIETMKVRAVASADEALVRAKAEFDKGNQVEVVRLLEAVPDRLLSENAKKILARVKSYTSEVDELANSLKEAIAQKEWPTVGGLIDQLLIHEPDDKQYLQVAQQVTVKLIAAAKQLFSAGRYSDAVTRLASVPSAGKDEAFDEIRQKIEDVEWLSRQFDCEPFVTPMLGRLAMRFAKEVPNDRHAQQMVKQMATLIKQADRGKRNPYPHWRGSTDCWMGGQVEFLGVPKSIDLGDQKPPRANLGRFHVAIGLALQGLGHARITEHFSVKKGLFKGIGWRKAKLCWGLDIGAGAIKAVCLSQGDDGVEMVDSYYQEFADPLCRAGTQSEKAHLISEALEKLIADREIEDAPVWSNIAGSDLINRFVRLPPVADKQAMSLLDLEITQRIPIAAEDLSITRWLGEADETEVHGRPAVITAAKREAVDRRCEILNDAGLNLVGLQGDTAALVNFLVYEFSDLLNPETDHSEESDQDAVDESEIGEDDDHLLPDPDSTTPTIAVIESGAATTSLILISAETHWLWTIENGGDDLTSALARTSKKTYSEAEQLKRNPAGLALPSKDYTWVEQRQDELRSRMEKVFSDAVHQNPRFDVVEAWCMGGGCLAHQWIRRFMLK